MRKWDEHFIYIYIYIYIHVFIHVHIYISYDIFFLLMLFVLLCDTYIIFDTSYPKKPSLFPQPNQPSLDPQPKQWARQRGAHCAKLSPAGRAKRIAEARTVGVVAEGGQWETGYDLVHKAWLRPGHGFGSLRGGRVEIKYTKSINKNIYNV